MIRFVFLFLPAFAVVVFTGCSGVNSALGGLAEKSLSGSGTVAIQRVGVDPDTAAPVLKSTIITGDYASAPEGTYALQYRRRTAPGIFNSSAISHEVTINYIGTGRASPLFPAAFLFFFPAFPHCGLAFSVCR